MSKRYVKPLKANYILKGESARLLRSNRPVVLMMIFITVLPSLLVSVASTLTGASTANYLMNLMQDATSVLYTGTPQEAMEAMSLYMQEKGWIEPVLNVIASLIQPVLSVGVFFGILTMLRTGATELPVMFQRLRYWGKAIGVSVLTALKVLLWSLPGIAVSLIAPLMMVISAANGGAVSEGLLTATPLLSTAGMALTAILAAMANYRYAMGLYILADKPETGVVACIRQSKQMMYGAKMQLFTLELGYHLWTYLAVMASGIFGGVLGSTVSMAAQLFINVNRYSAVCNFYLAQNGENPKDVSAVPMNEDKQEDLTD
ncbi:MAG: DUF975 family protein [Clostridiales bacterium]|nr:DUF975 family protein [Clostridiales bacterium]